MRAGALFGVSPAVKFCTLAPSLREDAVHRLSTHSTAAGFSLAARLCRSSAVARPVVALHTGRKGRHGAHAQILRFSPFTQMPCDEHLVRRLRAQRVCRHSAVANARHQYKPPSLGSTERSWLATAHT